MRRSTAFAVLALAALWPCAGGAAESLTEAGTFFDGVLVDVVNVEAFVTDARGEPITDLGPDDFELYVDGKLTPIRNFYTVGRARAAGDTTSSPGVEIGSPLTAPPEHQRLYAIVYVDNTSIRPSHRNQILSRLKTLLDRNLGPEDRVMIVVNGPIQKICHSFGDSRESLPAVLDEIALEAGTGSIVQLEEQRILRSLKRTSTADPSLTAGRTTGTFARDTRLAESQELLNTIRAHAQWRFDRTRKDIEAMRAFIGTLAGLPGRKALMYVGQGVSLRIGEPLFQAWVEKFAAMWSSVPNVPASLQGLSTMAEANRYNVRRYFTALASDANMSRVTFYAIDTSQISHMDHLNAARFGFEGGSQIHAMSTFGQHESLQLLAGTTGGRHITNLENVDRVVRDLATDFTSYYSLGFTPTESADGKYHSIEVDVKRKDAKVRSRRGFRTKSIDERMSDRLLAALFLDVTPNPLDVDLVIGDAENADDGRFRVPILVRIPVDRILLLPQADEHQGRLTVWVAIADTKGRSSGVQGRRIPVRIPNDGLTGALGQYVGYTVDVVVGKGARKVALNVRDELASVNSTVTLDLTVNRDGVVTGG